MRARAVTPMATPVSPAPSVRPDRTVPLRGLVLASVATLGASLLTLGAAVWPWAWVAYSPALALGAALAWRASRVTLAATALALLPAPLVFAAGQSRVAANPLASHEFIAGTLMLLALALGLPAGLAGSVRAAQRLRPTPAYALMACALALGASLTSGLAATHVREGHLGGAFDFTPDATLHVLVWDFAFHEDALPVRLGALTEVVVANHDTVLHTFSYENAGRTWSHDLVPESTTRFLVRFDAPGEYAVWCDQHAPHLHDRAHDRMDARFIARP